MAQSTSEKNNVRPNPMKIIAGEDNCDRWKIFKEAWEDFCYLENVYEKEPLHQVTAFRVAFGEANRQLLWNLGLGSVLEGDAMDVSKSKPCKSLKTILHALDLRFKRHENVIHRRYLFRRTTQTAGETISDFFDRVLRMSKSCQFGSVESITVRDQLVVGTNLSKAREDIFRDPRELTLEDVVAILRRSEENTAALQDIETGCKSSATESVQLTRPAEAEDEDEVFSLGFHQDNGKRKFFIALAIGESDTLKAQIDTGATASCMSLATFNHLRTRHAVSELDTVHTSWVRTFDNSAVRSVGRCFLNCRHKDRHFTLPFMIFSENVETLLSGRAAEDIGVVRFTGEVERVYRVAADGFKDDYEGLLAEYADIFEGLGQFPQPVKIEIDASVTPRQQAPRKAPVSTREALIKKIKQLEKDGIIQQVNYPTSWVSNLVQVLKKDGSIRITLDPSFLNRAIIRPRFPMPTLEDHLPLLARARVFSTVDAKDGFYQMKLDPKSSDLTTFWAPVGRYRYLRVPQGISSAPEEYQRRQIEAYEGLRGVLVVADDALIFGVGDTDAEAQADHDNNLKALFQRVRQLGIRLNRKKLQLGKPQVSYMGHLLSRHGVSPDPEKVRAITDMPAPHDTKSVMRFLGMANYLLRFVPALMEWEGRNFLITVDGYSDFFDITELGRKTTTDKVIKATKRLFSCFGRPAQLRTDSDPRYLSSQFKEFCATWEVKLRTSAPYHHSANGKAESAVKVAKRLVKKCLTQGEDLQLALLEWRNTPQKDGLTPAEKFLSRKPRSLLPSRIGGLQPKIPEAVPENIGKRRAAQKRQYDRGTHNLDRLLPGNQVRVEPVEHKKAWMKGTITEEISDRRYRVRLEGGNVLERNRRFLRRISSPAQRPQKEESSTSRDEVGPIWHGPGGPVVDEMTRIEGQKVETIGAGGQREQVLGEDNSVSEINKRSTTSGQAEGVEVHTRRGRAVKPPSRYRD